MKIKIIVILCIGILLSCKSDTENPIDKLSDMVSSLKETSTFNYVAYFKIKQDGATVNDTTNVYLEKTNKVGLLPLQYSFESASGEMQLFDGENIYTVLASERTIVHSENPPEYLIVSNQVLLFSPYYIQNYLAYLLENDVDAITFRGDTLINNQKSLNYEINTDYIYLLDGKIVQNGDLLPNQMKAENINKKHILTIDAKSNSPLAIKDFSSKDEYTEVRISPKNDSKLSYEDRAKVIDNNKYLTLSMDDYKQIQMSKQREFVNSQAKSFTLPLFPNSDFSLSELQDSPVLLEFWFPGCGFCIKAVPSLNSVFVEYQSKGLKIYGIEFSNASEERISKYIEKNNALFPTLYNGKNTSIDYGVNSGPTFILLDKNHKIVYFQNGLDYEELLKALEKVL